MLSEKELAIIGNNLQVPVIVSDILAGEGVLDEGVTGEGVLEDDVQYGLHEVLSEFQPDTALLTIALAVKQIALSLDHNTVSLNLLEIEAERIVCDYGPLWLQNARRQEPSEEEVLEKLIHVAEDLDTLDNLLSTAGLLIEDHHPAAELVEILRIQAGAQAMIAEEFIEAIEQTRKQEFETPQLMTDHAMAVDNVIPFPGTTTN